MDHQELARIILRSAAGELFPNEQQQLNAFLQASEANRQLYRELTTAELLEPKLAQYRQRNTYRAANYERILQQIHTRPVRTFHFGRITAAAAVLLLIATGIWLWQHPSSPKTISQTYTTDIAPGQTGAVLTLSDGREVVLDSMPDGVVASQYGAQAVMKKGQLSYQSQDAGATIAYHTMSTPKGRQFQLILPDGTKVWLNAASSLKYPTVFNGKERLVTVTGEAYFEVAQNASRPFRVKTGNDGNIEVLGTSFNVNAYANEDDISTTLLEGSVRIGRTILQPGQQLMLRSGTVKDANMDKVMAWKNGIFNFNDERLQDVMRQLERWYDIEVVYEKGVPDTYFYGKVSRDVSLVGILKVLEATRVHFRIEGRKLIVMP